MFREYYDKMLLIVVNFLGYFQFIIFKDLVSTLFGFIIGVLAICLISGNFLLNLHKIDTLNKVIMVKFKDDNKPIYFANPTNFKEAVHLMAIFLLSPLGKKGKFRKRDIKRTNQIVKLIVTLLIVLFILSIFLASTVILPDGGDGYNIYHK